MGFIKVVKNTAYFKRYQVKFRRRRQCKTDYYARHRLILQDKNKYKTPKYRFCVRFSNKDIVCQIFSADMNKDVCVASAYSHELKRYGVKCGYTNYAAAYCTGLLLARRVNAKFKLGYKGQETVDGQEYHVEPQEEGAAPFKCLLDVGLKRTTTGARLFGALKGACDGGLDIPHNTRRFPGSKKNEDGEVEDNAETHKKYILAGHVVNYMEHLKKEDAKKYKDHFNAFLKAGITEKNLSKMYSDAHAAIRKDPLAKRNAKELGRFKLRTKTVKKTDKPKSYKVNRLSASQRKARQKQKLKARGVKSIHELVAEANANNDDNMEEEEEE